MRENDDTRRQVWMALADQFLDTEVRHEIPRTAGLLVAAGYDLAEARRIWRYEVTPAVWPNLWNIAGEWAGWPEDWLVERIERLRGRWPNVEQPASYLLYRLRVHGLHAIWVAIEEAMALIGRHPRESHESLLTRLDYLARLYFDFVPGEPPTAGPEWAKSMLTLFERDFLPIFGPLAVRDPITGETPTLCRQRVIDVLATAPQRRSGHTRQESA